VPYWYSERIMGENVLAGSTILVVEDEEQVRTLVVRLLEKRGHRVLQAGNGRQALELVRERIHEIALVITDMVMPEMGGTSLLRELRQLRSALPALCMTGYSQEELAGSDGLEDVVLIEKPFTPAAFLERVDRLLNAGASSSA